MAKQSDLRGFHVWLRHLRKDPVAQLTRSGSLPLRYYLYRDVLKDRQSPDFRMITANLKKFKPRLNMLADQQPDGGWELQADTRHLSDEQVGILNFLQQLEHMQHLLDMAINTSDPEAQLGAAKLFSYLDANGRFPGRTYHHIQAVYLLLVFGLEREAATKKAVASLMSQQNKDGTWSVDLVEKGDSPVCLWTTLFAVMALGHSKTLKSNRALTTALQYVESNRLGVGLSPLLPDIQAWDHLHTGPQGLNVIQGGTLRVLEARALLGLKLDRPARKMFNWLQDQQLPNGHWPAIAGRDNHGDEWVTLRVLKLYRQVAGELVGSDYDEYD